MIKAIGYNILFSFIVYSYYFGYSLESYRNAFGTLSINTVGFLGIVIVCALLQVVYCRYKDRLFFGIIRKNEEVVYTKKEIWAVLLILTIALLLRVIGFNWGGNGFTFQPDESKVWHWAMLMAGDNTFMSSQINYPSHISHKILSVVYKIYHLFCFILGKEYTNINCLYVARIYMAVIGTGVVACMYHIGRRFSKTAGMIAAILTALYPPFISAGHNITGDSLMALCFCLSVLAAMRYWEEAGVFQSYQWIGIMSLLAAVATLEKYHGAIICVVIACSIMLRKYGDWRSYLSRVVREGMIALLLYVLFFTLISPNLVIRLNDVNDQLFKLTNDYESGATVIGNLESYFMWFFSHAGILSLVPACYALVCLIRKKDKRILLLATGIAELFVIILQNRVYIRWVYPFYLVLILLVGIGLAEMKSAFIVKKSNVRRFLTGSLLLLMLVNYFLGAVVTVLLYSKNKLDARNMAEKWCSEQGIEISDCVYDNYTCWNPGGISKYRAEVASVESSLEWVEDQYFVNRLGREYAVKNLSRYPVKDGDDLTLIKQFTVDYGQSKNAFSLYSIYSDKIYELNSIWHSILLIRAFLNDSICTGESQAVYDISGIPAFQEFDLLEFTSASEIDGRTEYILEIPKVCRGKYEITVYGHSNLDTMITIATGGKIQQVVFEDNIGAFKLKEDCSDLKVRILSNIPFDKVLITEIK